MEEDIIEKINNWISPIVTPLRDTDEIRFSVDVREANNAIESKRHLLRPTIDELIQDMNGDSFQ